MQLNKSSVVVITGGGSGIGGSMAAAFASRGATVVCADVDLDAAKAMAARLTADGGSAAPLHVDVTSRESLESVADAVYAEHGRVDVLCANAGVSMRPFRTTWNASMEDYRWLMEVNYFGFVNTALTFVPRMLEQTGRRQLVVTTSVASLDIQPGHGPYAATKGAVTSLTDAMRSELEQTDGDFGVTAFYPGTVRTNITNSERFRPAGERSESRELAVFETQRPKPYYLRFPADLSTVGELVAEAVERDAKTLLTYPYESSGLDERIELIKAGDPLRHY